MATFLLFLGSFSGVFLAFILGIWGQSAQRRYVDDVHRYETIHAILAELDAIKVNVSNHICLLTEEPDIFPVSTFFDDALQTAVSSGRFALLDADHQVAISRLYAWVQKAGELMFLGHRRPELWRPGRQEEIEWIKSEIGDILKELQERIPQLTDALSAAPQPSKSTWHVICKDIANS